MGSASLNNNNNSFIQNIVLEFTENIPLSELQEAATVVLEDDMMQRAIQSEREALTKKGYFIPSLKLKPHRNSRGGSRQSSRKNSAGDLSGIPPPSAQKPVADAKSKDIFDFINCRIWFLFFA